MCDFLCLKNSKYFQHGPICVPENLFIWCRKQESVFKFLKPCHLFYCDVFCTCVSDFLACGKLPNRLTSVFNSNFFQRFHSSFINVIHVCIWKLDYYMNNDSTNCLLIISEQVNTMWQHTISRGHNRHVTLIFCSFRCLFRPQMIQPLEWLMSKNSTDTYFHQNDNLPYCWSAKTDIIAISIVIVINNQPWELYHIIQIYCFNPVLYPHKGHFTGNFVPIRKIEEYFVVETERYGN